MPSFSISLQVTLYSVGFTVQVLTFQLTLNTSGELTVTLGNIELQLGGPVMIFLEKTKPGNLFRENLQQFMEQWHSEKTILMVMDI